MLTRDVWLVFNCFLFEKFYLHYALCYFDSILLHCTKLFIRQSIHREQIFDVTFQPPPIEKSCVCHCFYLLMMSPSNVLKHSVKICVLTFWLFALY